MGTPVLAVLLAVARPSGAGQNAAAVTNVAAPAPAVIRSTQIAPEPVRAARAIKQSASTSSAYGSTENDVHIPPVDISGAFEAKMLELSG